MSVAPFDVWSALGATTWTFGDGTTQAAAAVTHTYKKAGTFTVAVTALDALSNPTRATRSITITALPAISRLRLSPTTFRAAGSSPSVKNAATRTSTRVSYTLSLASTVRFTIQRATGGRRTGTHCATATKRNRSRKRCTRYVRLQGGFSRRRSAGTDRFTFTGRLNQRQLQPGRYRLRATPTAATRTGATATAHFTIRRRVRSVIEMAGL